MRLVTRLAGGTPFAHSLATVGSDVFFLSEAGVRAITTLPQMSLPTVSDVGSPIDARLRPRLSRSVAPRAIYDARQEHYLCALGQDVWVYRQARQAPLSAWSRYVLPFAPEAWAACAGGLYLRHGDHIYRFSDTVHTDDGAPFEVVIEGPDLTLEAPGRLKRLLSAQVLSTGETTLSIAYDPQRPESITPPIRLPAHPVGSCALDLSGFAFSLRFTHQADAPFRLDALTLTFETLGP
jgi:hypothetical protein